MDANHTPGPWEVNPAVAQVDAMPSRLPVCQLLWPTRERSEAETEANARLISAAPDLLVVARDFNEVLTELGQHCECGQADCRTTRLRAAIAKATGSAA